MRCLALALPLLLAGCSPSRTPANIATTAASQEVVGGTTLLLPSRICVNIVTETTRARRLGQRGLVRTNALASELTQQKASSGAKLMNGCEDELAEEAPSELIGKVQAAPNLVTRIRAEHATRTIVTEISTRMLCQRARSLEQCIEDDVMLSAIVLDGEGRAIHAISLPVEDDDQVRAAVRTLLGSFAHGAPGSGAVGGACQLRDHVLDCTG